MTEKELSKELFLSEGIVQLIIAIGAIPAGIMFIIDPSGESMGFGADALKLLQENSPFEDYLIPGIILLLINGLATLISAIFSFKKHNWSGYLGLIFGFGLIIWIIVQLIILDGFGEAAFLQILFLILGIIEFFLGFFMFRELNK